jgi:hypothetical protein
MNAVNAVNAEKITSAVQGENATFDTLLRDAALS